jgi:hypothetical protein
MALQDSDLYHIQNYFSIGCIQNPAINVFFLHRPESPRERLRELVTEIIIIIIIIIIISLC